MNACAEAEIELEAAAEAKRDQAQAEQMHAYERGFAEFVSGCLGGGGDGGDEAAAEAKHDQAQASLYLDDDSGGGFAPVAEMSSKRSFAEHGVCPLGLPCLRPLSRRAACCVWPSMRVRAFAGCGGVQTQHAARVKRTRDVHGRSARSAQAMHRARTTALLPLWQRGLGVSARAARCISLLGLVTCRALQVGRLARCVRRVNLCTRRAARVLSGRMFMHRILGFALVCTWLRTLGGLVGFSVCVASSITGKCTVITGRMRRMSFRIGFSVRSGTRRANAVHSRRLD